MPQRKLARVLPEPVGAQISALAPLGDRLPAAGLGGRRPLEGGLEPAPDGRAERRQRVRFRASISHRRLNPPILRVRCP